MTDEHKGANQVPSLPLSQGNDVMSELVEVSKHIEEKQNDR